MQFSSLLQLISDLGSTPQFSVSSTIGLQKDFKWFPEKHAWTSVGYFNEC